ncbi:MAG: hypothetical protein JW797_06055 [Bradymonadales bacterium]|nr:hypothetical protein [Bradymonadales bacterium]
MKWRGNEQRVQVAVLAYLSLVVGVIQAILLNQTEIELTEQVVEPLIDPLLKGLDADEIE